MSASRLVRLPLVPSRPSEGVRDARAKEEYFVSRVLNGVLGLNVDVAGASSDPVLCVLREQAPQVVSMLEEIGSEPIVVNVKYCTRGVSFHRQSVEVYKTEIDVILGRLIPKFRSFFLDPDDEAANTMVWRALLRVSPWLLDFRLNAYGLFNVLLPQCEYPGLLAGVFDHRVKPQYRRRSA